MLTDLFGFVLKQSIMASAVVCIILFVKSIFKERLSAAWNYYIWILLFIGLVIPYIPQYSLDLPNNDGKAQRVIVDTVEKNEINIETEQDITLETSALDYEKPWSDFDNIELEYAETKVLRSNNSMEVIIEVAAIVWLVGFILLLIYTLAINISIRLRVRQPLILSQKDVVTKLIEECSKSMEIVKILPVSYQNFGNAPALYGILRPVLLLPPEIENKITEDELRYVILHELCHYKRKDNVTGFILMIFNLIHWFNPLMWLAGSKIKEDRELVCDQQVLIHVSSDEKRNYAKAILKILELFSQKQFIQSASSIIQGRASAMEWRLKFIKTIKRKSKVLAVCITAIVVLASVLTINYINGSVKFPKSAQAIIVEDDKEELSVSINDSKEELRGNITDRNGVNLVERTIEGSNYIYGNLASHILGSVNNKDANKIGIEKLMDDRGFTSNNITLTVDINIQKVVENILEKAVQDTKADGAAAIVMDPVTGEVLALYSNPNFDPNNPISVPEGYSGSEWEALSDEDKVEYLSRTVWRNKAIGYSYEPASTFKAITAAAGLEEGVITLDSIVDDYTVNVNGHSINCWNPNAHGVETFKEAMYNSCNPTFVKIAQNLGIDKFYNYVKLFGFYELTGIEIPGESESLFHKKPTEIDMAVASFGQRFHVTPIQVLSAYCAIANGGNLLEPQIMMEISDSKGKKIEVFEPKVVRRVISEQTSIKLRELLEGVVTEGTGKNAYAEGYRIAGKTGTSETNIDGRYIASFVGFAPADNPKVACIVMIDNPKGEKITGGLAAAPAAGQIIKQSLDVIEQSN